MSRKNVPFHMDRSTAVKLFINVAVQDTLNFGGCTYGLDTKPPYSRYTPSVGYLVGGARGVHEMVTSPGKLRDVLECFWTAHCWKVCPEYGTFLGTWIDPNSNTVHVDVSEVYYDREAAIATARERGEHVIWDVAKGESITVQP